MKQARSKTIRSVAAAVILAAAISLTGCYTFFGRMVSYLLVDPFFDTDWYQPAEMVPGNTGEIIPTASGDELAIPAQAITKIVDYALISQSCALIILKDGKIEYEEYWCQLDRQSRTNPMSQSKTLVALLIGIAIEEGYIKSVDEPAYHYITEWAGDDRSQITIGNLLNMTSGLRSTIDGFASFTEILWVHLGANSEEVVLAIPAERPPGQSFEYNSSNTQLLSLILERATGVRYAEYLSEKLWQPIGADDAMIWLDRPGGSAKTYCCFMARARDWARVGELVLNKGNYGGKQIVPHEWVEKMLTPSEAEVNYGYHIWLGAGIGEVCREYWSEPFEDPQTAMLSGIGEQRVFIIPSENIVVVRIGYDYDKWEDPYIPNTIIREIRAERIQHLTDKKQPPGSTNSR